MPTSFYTEVVQLEGIGASSPLPHAPHTTTVLPVGNSPPPSILIVDSELHVVVGDSDGLMTRTGKKITIIDSTDGATPSTASTPSPSSFDSGYPRKNADVSAGIVAPRLG